LADQYLKKAGHHVTVFHRGTTATPEDVGQILGDHHQLRNYREQFQLKILMWSWIAS